MFTRRYLFKASAATGAAVLLSRPLTLRSAFAAAPAAPTTLSQFTELLPIPPLLDLTGGGSLSLAMANGQHQFHAALPPTPTFGYGGAGYLGPTIETRRGVAIDLTASNNLGAHPLGAFVDTTIHGAQASDAAGPRASLHLHGGNTEPASDGHPEDTFVPGAGHAYHYHNNQEAASLWYHDHALGITRLNVYAGLAAVYWLRDTIDTGRPGGPLGLPTGPYEIPLALQDRSFNADGTFNYPVGPTGRTWSPEAFGDVATVNGKAWPNLAVDRGLYRFRIYNGSNARFYNISLTGNLAFQQIGTDGGLLNAPVAVKQLLLGPGERADVLVDFTRSRPGDQVTLTNDAPAPFPTGPRAVRRGGMPLRSIMRFTVSTQPGFAGARPALLRATPIPALPLPPVGSGRVRNLTLVEILDPVTGVPLKALLNNLPFTTSQVETPAKDTGEQWTIVNTTGDAHPIHLHLVQFQVLNRQRFNVKQFLAANYPLLPSPDGADDGPLPAPAADAFLQGQAKPPDPNEQGWKDTVRAMPGEVTRLLVPFGANAVPGTQLAIGESFTGNYVWHCHILEHEDNEMMLPYRVV